MDWQQQLICAYWRQSDTLKLADIRCRYIMLNMDEEVFLVKDVRKNFSSI